MSGQITVSQIDSIDKRLDRIDRLAAFAFKMCVIVFILSIVMIATAIAATDAPGIGTSIPIELMITMMVNQIKFFGSIIVIAVTTIQGLVIYIYRDGQVTMRNLFKEQLNTVKAQIDTVAAKTVGDVNGIGSKVRGGLERIDRLELGMKEYLTKEHHDDMCRNKS
jgi:hypothetical protein